MAIIQLGTIVTYWQNMSDWITNIGNHKPIILKSGRVQSVLTTTPLLASGIYTSATFDTTLDPQKNLVCASIFSDTAGTLYMDTSSDSVNWNYTQSTVSVVANTATVMGWQNPMDKYFRIRFVNTATVQSVFRLSMTSMT